MKRIFFPTTVRETVVSDGKHNRQVLYGTFFLEAHSFNLYIQPNGL